MRDRFKSLSLASVAAFLILIFGALFVRLHGLSEYDFNDDELWHLVVANRDSAWDLLKYNFREEVHPPLSFIIWHFMLKISHNDLWLRMSAIVPGILLIPSAYIFGRLYLGKTAGWAMAFLMAFGAVPVVISTVIRAYVLMMLALIWASIFLHKFQYSDDTKSRKKYLIYYFLSALAAIELNHAAIFTICAFGVVLAIEAITKRSRKEFVAISLIHIFLALLVAGYAVILKHFYGLHDIASIFSEKNISGYFINYMTFFVWFSIGEIIKDSAAEIMTLIGSIAFFIAPIVLVKNRKWQLLIITLAPVFLVSIADYFRIYPFTGTQRNNLFLIISAIAGYGYFVQILVNFLVKIFHNQHLQNKRNLLVTAQILATLIVVVFTVKYVVSRDVFRKTMPNCVEFGVKKTDTKNLWERLERKDTADNVFVTVVRNIWYLRLQYGDEGHLSILTDNLGKFEYQNRVIYFTAIPPRERSITTSMKEYQSFFQDLFAHLEKEGKMNKVKSFTFFDIGFNIDCLTRRFVPQMVSEENDPFVSTRNKPFQELWQEGYHVSWAIHTSNQVLDHFYFRDISYQCGREILILSFTPKFVREEFLNKKFLDGRKIYDEVRLNEK